MTALRSSARARTSAASRVVSSGLSGAGAAGASVGSSMGFMGQFLPYNRKPMPDQNSSPTHVTLAVVLQVRDSALGVLLWQGGRPPFERAWSLPGGYLEHGDALD